MKYKIGDIVQVKVYTAEDKEQFISRDGSKKNDYEIFNFKIIGKKDDSKEYLLDTSNTNLAFFICSEDPRLAKKLFDLFSISNNDREKLRIITPVWESAIVPVGFNCIRCNSYNEYISIPNQSDGTYKCYSCRNAY